MAECQCDNCEEREMETVLSGCATLYPVCNAYNLLCPTVLIVLKGKACPKAKVLAGAANG